MSRTTTSCLSLLALLSTTPYYSSTLAFSARSAAAVTVNQSTAKMTSSTVASRRQYFDIPKQETGIHHLQQKYGPKSDGTGIKIAIMDTGCDLSAAGLSGTCSDGVTPKYIDFVDCTGDGDVDMSSASATVVKFDYENNGTKVEGLSGRNITVGEWAKNVSEFKLGAVRLYELLPRSVARRVKRERKEVFMVKHMALLSKTQLQLDDLNNNKTNGGGGEETDDKDVVDKKKKELKLLLEQLTSIKESYDEDSGPLMDILMFQDNDDGCVWKTVIDIDTNGDLTKSIPMAPFRHERQVGELGFGSHVTFCVQVYDEGKTLSIVTDAGSHGTHVAGIAASYFPPKEGEDEGKKKKESSDDLNGVAPGAQILALKIGDGRLGSSETGTGLIRGLITAKKYGCDLVNLSYGEPSWQPDSGRVSEVFAKAFNDWGMTVFTSAGNDGPALSSLGSPGSLTSVVTVGAYVSPEMIDPSMKTLGVGAVPGGSLYPWTWHENDADLANFNVLHDNQLNRIEYTQLSREGMTTTRK